jgi:chromate transporter
VEDAVNGDDTLFSLTLHLLLLSLLAIGGVSTILPELHRFIVVDHSWLTNEQFTALFALAQAAPGPNVIFVTLIGWQISGLVGALAATAAMCGPATVIAYVGTRLSTQWQHLKWFKIVRSGLVPVTTGLMIASAWLLTAASAQTAMSYAVTAVTALLVLTTRINPLWLLALAAGAGMAGWA